MSITIDVPDGIARDLQDQSGNVARMAKGALAMEGYRTGMLSIGQVASILGLKQANPVWLCGYSRHCVSDIDLPRPPGFGRFVASGFRSLIHASVDLR